MKIVVVGNSSGGKTKLSKQLSSILNISVHHVDSHQFTSDLKIRPHTETIRTLQDIEKQPAWIIDGFGPLDIIENRFSIADKIVFIDFPIWRHYLWSIKRQVTNLWSPRLELPAGANELSLEHSLKLFKDIWQVHTKMRPELLRIFERPANRQKMVYIRDLKDWKNLCEQLSQK